MQRRAAEVCLVELRTVDRLRKRGPGDSLLEVGLRDVASWKLEPLRRPTRWRSRFALELRAAEEAFGA